MSTDALRTTLRPAAERADYREPSLYRVGGVALALVGLLVAAVALITNLVVADEGVGAVDTLAWTFGIQSTALAMVMIGIAVVLIGILLRDRRHARVRGLGAAQGAAGQVRAHARGGGGARKGPTRPVRIATGDTD